MTLDDLSRQKLEAAAFRGLVGHLQKRTDVQNIDLMNLAGFCRNCLYKWYFAAAQELGLDLTEEDAQIAVYGMTAREWKQTHQTPASAEQLAGFEASKPRHAKIGG